MKAMAMFFLVGAIILTIPQRAPASPISFSVDGTGAQSPGIPAISNSPFWWIDSRGGVTGAAGAPFGFDLFQAPGINGIPDGWTGSLLTSSAFTLGDGETLNVALTLLSTMSDNWYGLGFAVLLEDSTVTAILASSRPDGIGHFGDLVHPPDADFNKPGSDVAFKATSGPISSNFQLGGRTYGPSGFFGSCEFHVCETSILSSTTPGAGTYQLLFGSFDLVGAGPAVNALAVTDVSTTVPKTVPQPATLLLLGLPIAMHFVRRRRV